MKPRVSFIVPVRNDARRLETCLRSITRNCYAPGLVEIIVVDNASTDDSAAVARRFGAEVVAVEDGKVAALRNRGARHARAGILAFVDADNEIGAGWVYTAIACLQMPGVGAAGALYEAPADGTWVQRSYGHLRGVPHGQHDAEWLGSGNLAVTKQVFEALKGFDTDLETCEDVDFCRRLRTAGFRLVSDARLQSVHHGDPRTLWDVLSSERWRGRDNLRVSFRRPIAWSGVTSALIAVGNTLLVLAAILGLVASAIAGAMGLVITTAAVTLFAAASSARAIRAVVRNGSRRVGLLQAIAVACAYDIGRALAIVSRASHRGAAPRTVRAAS